MSHKRRDQFLPVRKRELADGGTNVGVLTPTLRATAIATSIVRSAGRGLTSGPSAWKSSELKDCWLLRPKYVHHLVWDPDNSPSYTTVDVSEFQHRVPSPPPSQLNNVPALQTMESNYELFKVVTPIKVDLFESL